MSESNPLAASSNLRIMRALLAKDWRLNRTTMVGLIAAGAGCYLICMAIIPGNHSSDNEADKVAGAVLAGAAGALALTALLASAFGGIAIAGERTDRTSDFIGLLPVTRTQIILSKWIVSTLMLGTCAAFHVLVALTAALIPASPERHALLLGLTPTEYEALRKAAEGAACWAAVWTSCAISFFGVAWLPSTFTRSGPISACISIAITSASVGVALSLEGHTQRELLLCLFMFPAAVGLASLAVGTLYYLRRVAP